MAYTEQPAKRADSLSVGGTYDFSPLDAFVASANVVLLGEQDHGDGAAFSFKAELVRYLHLTHGFNVLAFEADFYALTRAWLKVKTPADVPAWVAPHVYFFWRTFAETRPLWRLIEDRFSSASPLIVAGLDPRHSRHGSADLLAELDTCLKRYKVVGGDEVALKDDLVRFRALLQGMLEHEYQHKVNALERATFFRTLHELRRRLGAASGDNASYWRQELRNLGFCARNAWSFEGRDEGMAANLEWLARERYPEAKIIVWAHNFHIAKDTALIVRADGTHIGDYHDTLLGEKAAERLAGVCSLGFVSAEGWYHPEAYQGNLERREDLETPPAGSLEAQLSASGLSHAFLDLRAPPKEPFSMSGVTHNNPSIQHWADAYDGLIFIRTMHGLTR